MLFLGKTKRTGLFGLLFASLLVSACNTTQETPRENLSVLKKNIFKKEEKSYSYPSVSHVYPLSERACLERAMFFEANRSSREGLVAVGTVVMNRVNSSNYPDTICGVVGQKNQFAPGVLTRPINLRIIPDVRAAADAVLKGERHPKLKSAMFFHTAGLKFPYRNMHYKLVAGGNAFYEKRDRNGLLSASVNDQPYNVAYAFAQEKAAGMPAFEEQMQNHMMKKPVLVEKAQIAAAAPLVTVPVPQFKAMAEATTLGYSVPDIYATDVIGALLRAQ